MRKSTLLFLNLEGNSGDLWFENSFFMEFIIILQLSVDIRIL